MSDTILIVDDEEPIRRTFAEWLTALNVTVLTAHDAEAALRIANETPLDLAVLDWNLGSGSDGLSLLEDLVEFQPDLVAILITGYAAQATPLEALRHGVRDYLDKNADLTREAFLAAVRKQLDFIGPAKRQRALNASLANFRESVEKVLPLVKASAALNEPVTPTRAVKSLVDFALQSTGATDGVLIVRSENATRAYTRNGELIECDATPFPDTLAAAALSLGEPAAVNDLSKNGSNKLFPFEVNRRSVLAIPIPINATAQAVLELFDKPQFTDADRALTKCFADIGSELFQISLAERQTHRMLADAVEAALAASTEVSSVMNGSAPPSDPPPAAVLDSLRKGLDTSVVDADLGLDLVTAVRELAIRHGPEAVRHCVKLVRDLRMLLDGLT
jgi:ActR/RegA family two-component response regulator